MKTINKTKKVISTLLVLTIVFASSTVVFAAQFSISTLYPDTTSGAGETVSFSLDMFTASDSGEKVDIDIISQPEGFDGKIYGGGNEISTLYIKEGQNTAMATYQVEIPEDTPEGTYSIAIQASGESGTSNLNLNIKISEEVVGNSAIVTEYAEQEGSTYTSFTFSSTIQNNTPTEQSYSLSAQAPTGWTVGFSTVEDMTQVAGLTLDKHSSKGISISVMPPDDLPAGEYIIPISAISATETLSSELTVRITGTHDITVSTPTGRLSFDATANKPTEIVISVTNNGNVDLNNINMTTEAPVDWNVSYSESTIEVLQAGATKEITATVTPSKDSLSGDYLTGITAQTPEVSSSAEFRVSVKTETIWGVIGIAVIAATGVGLYFLFQKYGRR